MIDKKSKRAAQRAQKRDAAKYFERIAALNMLIDKGGEEAKDAAAAKVNLAKQCEWKINATLAAKTKHKKYDILDSRKRLPGSYESGKRR